MGRGKEGTSEEGVRAAQHVDVTRRKKTRSIQNLNFKFKKRDTLREKSRLLNGTFWVRIIAHARKSIRRRSGSQSLLRANLPIRIK
jgi:hypothetical protein